SYELTKQMGEAADFPGKNSMKEYVFSDTLSATDSSSIIIRRNDALQTVQQLKQQPGKDIWLYGGSDLIRFFMQHQLVDILWLSVHPILLGAGKPLFTEISERQHVELIDAKTYDTG